MNNVKVNSHSVNISYDTGQEETKQKLIPLGVNAKGEKIRLTVNISPDDEVVSVDVQNV
jgi:hypothetical protein